MLVNMSSFWMRIQLTTRRIVCYFTIYKVFSHILSSVCQRLVNSQWGSWMWGHSWLPRARTHSGGTSPFRAWTPELTVIPNKQISSNLEITQVKKKNSPGPVQVRNCDAFGREGLLSTPMLFFKLKKIKQPSPTFDHTQLGGRLPHLWRWLINDIGWVPWGQPCGSWWFSVREGVPGSVSVGASRLLVNGLGRISWPSLSIPGGQQVKLNEVNQWASAHLSLGLRPN